MATKHAVRCKRPLPGLFAGRICPLSALAVVMSPWSGCAAAPAGRRARARSPRCMRFGRACPRGSPAPFARTRARLWGALRGPQNPQRWPWCPRSHASHFARFASLLTLRADEGTCYGHSRLLAAAGNRQALAGVAGARSPKARFLTGLAAGAAVGARRAQMSNLLPQPPAKALYKSHTTPCTCTTRALCLLRRSPRPTDEVLFPVPHARPPCENTAAPRRNNRLTEPATRAFICTPWR